MFLVDTDYTSHRDPTKPIYSAVDCETLFTCHKPAADWILVFTRQQENKNKGLCIAYCCLCCFNPWKREMGTGGECIAKGNTTYTHIDKKECTPVTMQWPFIAPRRPRSRVTSDVNADVNLDRQWHSKSLLWKSGRVTAALAATLHSNAEAAGLSVQFTLWGMYECSCLGCWVALLPLTQV